MAETPTRLSASQEFTESFFGAVPQSPEITLNQGVGSINRTVPRRHTGAASLLAPTITTG